MGEIIPFPVSKDPFYVSKDPFPVSKTCFGIEIGEIIRFLWIK